MLSPHCQATSHRKDPPGGLGSSFSPVTSRQCHLCTAASSFLMWEANQVLQCMRVSRGIANTDDWYGECISPLRLEAHEKYYLLETFSNDSKKDNGLHSVHKHEKCAPSEPGIGPGAEDTGGSRSSWYVGETFSPKQTGCDFRFQRWMLGGKPILLQRFRELGLRQGLGCFTVWSEVCVKRGFNVVSSNSSRKPRWLGLPWQSRG